MEVKIHDEPNLVKDTKSGAILNIDHRSLQVYKLRKAQARQLQAVTKRMEQLERTMDELIRRISEKPQE